MTTRAGSAAAVAGVLFALALWASTSGSVRIWHEPADSGRQPPSAVVDTTALDGTIPSGQEQQDDGGFPWIVQTLLLVFLFVAIVIAGYLLRGPFRLRWRPREDDKDGFAVLPDVADAVTDDADAQLAALSHGSPRNAIVACWVRLEDAVASAGLAPNPAETAAELTARVLASYRVAREAIDELTALYREARFSEHELGEQQRDRALEALRRLHADLTRPHHGSDVVVRAVPR